MTRKKVELIERLDLPRDLTLGASIITVVGEMELTIENYKGILDYCEELILVQGKTKQIQIIGKQLAVDYYTNEDMKITGIIQSITYL
ncbi:MAG: YabP/YqfC family sporulation protein [Eubacteriales bacterium]